MQKFDLKKIDLKSFDFKKLDKKQKMIAAGIGALVVIVIAFLSMPGSTDIQHKTQAPIASNVYEINDEASFIEKTTRQQIMPFNRPDLEFQINVPTNWEIENLSTNITPDFSQKILSDIVQIKSPLFVTSRAEINVRSLVLEHEISAKNWLRNYIQSNGYVLHGDVEEKDEKRASAYYSRIENLQNLHVYITVQFTGNMALLAQFVSPLPVKEYLSFLQKRMIDSFQTTLNNNKTIEEKRIFTLIDAIKFEYPVSWEITAPDFRDMSRLSVQILNKNSAGTTEGYIGFIAIRRSRNTDIRKEFDELKKFFAEKVKIEFSKLIAIERPKVTDRFIFSRLERYEAKSTEKLRIPQEIRLLALGDKEWYIFIYMISPTETANLYNWARNSHSFDVIMQSVR